MRDKPSIKSAFESMMYIFGEPLEAKEAGAVFGLTEQEAVDLFDELQVEYDVRRGGLRIRRVENSFQFVTAEENAEAIRRLCTPVRKKKLSQAALEVLAIIAYRQPVTKGVIDSVRGIRCDRVVEGLEAKGLIEEKGRSDAVGRPILYGTTPYFLEQFGFESIDELPEIDDIESVIGAPDPADEDEPEDESRQIAIRFGEKSAGAGTDDGDNAGPDDRNSTGKFAGEAEPDRGAADE